jgi:hypothetical protein
MFLNVISDSLPALINLFLLTCLMCVFFASCVHYAEGTSYSVDFDPARFPQGVFVRPTFDHFRTEHTPFRSIPYAFWWFFTTATTVGYGDDYPTTTAGRLVGITTFYAGIVLIALPLTTIGQSFNKYYPDWVDEFLPVRDHKFDHIRTGADMLASGTNVDSLDSGGSCNAEEAVISVTLCDAHETVESVKNTRQRQAEISPSSESSSMLLLPQGSAPTLPAPPNASEAGVTLEIEHSEAPSPNSASSHHCPTSITSNEQATPTPHIGWREEPSPQVVGQKTPAAAWTQ